MTDKFALKKLIAAAQLKPKDVVLEIGPGVGNLTQELAKKVKKVIAVEKDPRMIDILGETLEGFQNVEIIQGDILKIPDSKFLIHNSYKVVANLPFYLTAPVIRKFLEKENQPEFMVFIVQKEVAQRICAKPPAMSLLAVSVQLYAKPKIMSYVSKKSFWPQPKVDSAIIKLEIRNSKFAIDSKAFFRVVKAGFSSPRKQLVNNLSKGLKLDKAKVSRWLLKNNIKPEQRAETLTVDDWLSLQKSFSSFF